MIRPATICHPPSHNCHLPTRQHTRQLPFWQVSSHTIPSAPARARPCHKSDIDPMSTPDHASNLAREDVHKSCKSLETVVNLLNGYCEATNAIVLLQRKLAKAIRDTASMKASPAVASNCPCSQPFAQLSSQLGQTTH